MPKDLAADAPRISATARERLGALLELLLWLAVTAAMFVASAALRTLVSTPLRIVLSEPAEMLALFALATVLMRRRGQTWADLGLRWPASWGRTAALVAGGLVATYATGAAVLYGLLRPMGLPSPDVKILASLMGDAQGYAVMMGLTWTTVAFGEEMQFRGFVFSRFATLFGPGRTGALAAWLAQGLMFGALHGYQGVAGVATTGSVGLVLGAVYLIARRNLIACIILHGLIDTASLTAMYYAVTHGLKLP